MEIQALGPLVAEHDGVSLALGGARQRLVLAVLLTRCGRSRGRVASSAKSWASSRRPSCATSKR